MSYLLPVVFDCSEQIDPPQHLYMNTLLHVQIRFAYMCKHFSAINADEKHILI